MPSITIWSRLEPHSREASMERSLQAQIRDPLWLLARQDQVGEFLGRDAGSPVKATMATESVGLSSYRPGATGAVTDLTGPPLEVLQIPHGWLVDRPDDPRFDSRLVGAAMLVGTAVATLTAPRAVGGVVAAFCEGAGYAFQHIISLIVSAACFGEGIKQIGLAGLIGKVIQARPGLLLRGAGALPLSFCLLCGSGMAATQALFGFFAEPALQLGLSPVHVGAVVSVAAAAGRTMSPVAAVTLMCAAMTQTDAVILARRVAGPLLLSTTVVVVAAMLLGPRI